MIRSRALVLDDIAGRHRTAADASRIARVAQERASASQRLWPSYLSAVKRGTT
jgi:hypothetical protein